MAIGTESVPRVDVLVGPGNAYVNEAKRQLAGTVRIDSPAGPSELLILADSTAEPAWVAAEVIAGLASEEFLILPHKEVIEYRQRKADNYDRWLGGMRKLRRAVGVPTT